MRIDIVRSNVGSSSMGLYINGVKKLEKPSINSFEVIETIFTNLGMQCSLDVFFIDEPLPEELPLHYD